MKRQLTQILTFVTLIILSTSNILAQKSIQFYSVPKQTIDLFKMLGITQKTNIQTVKSFQISEFITFKEYKDYLVSVKKDSSEKYYKTQLPDTNITKSKEVYSKYVTGEEYDYYPVLGISWDNAMNFCEWKTKKENKDSIVYVYRLPLLSEWLASYYYFQNNNISTDMNKNYSDWVLNTRDESNVCLIGNRFDHYGSPFDCVYLHEQNDSKIQKRKRVVGNSFLFSQEKLMHNMNYNATEGYRYVSFRCVKEHLSNDVFMNENESLANMIIKHWKIKRK